MLLAIVLLLSATVSGLVCTLTGAFHNELWYWLLPVSYIGAFLVLAGLAFAFFMIVCACIDPDKERDQDCPWFRKMVLRYIDAVLTVLPVRIKTQGMDKMVKEGRFLLVCNHLDNIDPAFILHQFPKRQISFVAKKETRNMFVVDKVLPKMLCPLINRENDREALKTILRCIHLLKTDTVSIAIFPEGRINPYKKLAHFRPGVFKIAQTANVPIVVCTLQNTQHVIKRVLRCKGTTVHLHLLDVIPVEEVQSATTVDLAHRIYQMMADDLGPENVLTPEEEENA